MPLERVPELILVLLRVTPYLEAKLDRVLPRRIELLVDERLTPLLLRADKPLLFLVMLEEDLLTPVEPLLEIEDVPLRDVTEFLFKTLDPLRPKVLRLLFLPFEA